MKLKHMYKQLSLLAFIAIGSIGSLMAQSRIYIHSHNDYCQSVPFYQVFRFHIY